MKDIVRTYMAGILDGEGSICISKQSSSNGCVLSLTVNHTSAELVQWIYDNFGGHLYGRDYFSKLGYQPQFQWIVTGHKVLPILQEIKDYLIVKKAQAELAIEFQAGKGIPGKHTTYERRDYEWLAHSKMSELNHGVSRKK